jgi:hypothetical protein
MNRPHSRLTALLIAFAAETLCVTWCLKLPGWAPWLSVPYFVAGVVIAFLLLGLPALQIPRLRLTAVSTPAAPGRPDPVIVYRLATIGLMGVIIYTWCRVWFEDWTIDIANADMLPVIKVMGERFLAGQHSHIYDRIPWIWNGVQPIYLPAMWQPYVPFIAMGIDMRWVTAACLLFSFGVFVAIYRPQAYRYLSFFLAATAFLLFWWIVADNTAGIISVSEEGTVIAYYVLLVLALVSGKPWLTGIAASLCMLSRYAFIGWVPAYLLYLVLERRWRYLLWFVLTGAGCFVLFFLIPVGWETFLRLASLPGDYVAFAARVWKDSPDVFSTAPGFAWFFGPRGTGFLHRLLLTASFGVPMLFMAFCYRRWRGARPANLPVAMLKLTLVVFYCCIDVPYLYLFYTSSMVSLVVVTLAFRGEAAATRESAATP